MTSCLEKTPEKVMALESETWTEKQTRIKKNWYQSPISTKLFVLTMVAVYMQ